MGSKKRNIHDDICQDVGQKITHELEHLNTENHVVFVNLISYTRRQADGKSFIISDNSLINV